MIVKCDAKTCSHYDKGKCGMDLIQIKNFTWYDEEDKEEKDLMECNTYRYFKDWMCR